MPLPPSAVVIVLYQIFMPTQEIFFAPRFAMLRDKFGTSWMILTEA
jgi:uncharacterized glyoxalase superfamily protein PhnB